MSLATRCSECGTMFRVVQDQLRVSEGWVRCGRCDTVFNALDALVDLDAEPVAPAPALDRAPTDEPFYADAGAEEHDFEDGPHRRPVAAAEPASSARRVEFDDGDEARHDVPATAPAPWPAAAEPTGWDADIGPVHVPLTVAAASEPGSPMPPRAAGLDDTPAAAHVTAASPKPGFVRRAERDARWGSPAMRAALIGTALILTGMLAMQALYHFRDAAAARSPMADRLLRGACARWGCRIEAPRRIQDVTLEGSGLARVPQQPQAVKLTINLRNRGDTDLMLPSVDLSLTDAKGELIARRSLGAADFHIDPPRIRRGAELPMELMLSTGDRAISGYTVELFYP